MSTQAEVEDAVRLLHDHIVAKELVQYVAVEHVTSFIRPGTGIPFKPEQKTWHRFLDEICHLCDFKSGGKTVRSIAVENASNGDVIFWAASIYTDSAAFKAHLETLLEELKSLVSRKNRTEETATAVHDLSMGKASARIRVYSALFVESADQAINKLSGGEAISDTSLLVELKELKAVSDSYQALCHRAYDKFRHTDAQGRLEYLIEHDHDTLWTHLRHRIGRLGSFKRASRFLAKNAPEFANAIRNAKVKLIDPQPRVRTPISVEPDIKVLLTRVCPWLKQEDVLAQAAKKLETAEKKLKSFREHTLMPSVHAEVIVLNHFFSQGLRFADDDRYIGCSKPSCYCCSLYFDAHPGEFVQRPCHGNAYVRWSPPRSRNGKLSTVTVEVLQSMTRDVQEELRCQIMNNIYGRKRSRDSETAQTVSCMYPVFSYVSIWRRNTRQHNRRYHKDLDSTGDRKRYGIRAEVNFIAAPQRRGIREDVKFQGHRQIQAKSVYYVPPALISEHSEVLHELMHEDDGETVKTWIALEDVDEDTFARFVEYLYTGEYAAAKPMPRVQSIEALATENSDFELTPATSKVDPHEGFGLQRGSLDEPRQDFWCNQVFRVGDSAPQAPPEAMNDEVFGFAPSKKVVKAGKVAKKPEPEKATISAQKKAWETFKALSWPVAKKEAKGPEYFARPNENGDEDYTRVLLSHARLHVFACVWDITRLKALTLKNLHKTLVAFTIFDACALDIAELMVYSYSEQGDRSVAELRELVNDYVACNVQKLMKVSAFRDAVKGCEGASFHLFELVVERMQLQE
ncbi:hypothetical protein BST61_g2443 [Cercospora zeina]